jgi:hypothetical protein
MPPNKSPFSSSEILTFHEHLSITCGAFINFQVC